MPFGRFRLARSRSLLAFSLVFVCSLEFKSWAQQAPASSPVENAVPALPPAQPLAQAAVGSAPNNANSGKALPSGASANAAVSSLISFGA